MKTKLIGLFIDKADLTHKHRSEIGDLNSII